jgi:flagellar M-ring protein FliF
MDVLLQFLKKLSFGKIISLIVVLALAVFSFSYIFNKYSAEQMVTLYSNLELEDSNRIITELESKNVPYELTSNGSQILVPETMVLKLRMSMAKDGLPGKGAIVGYEIFDNADSFSTSTFIQNIHLVRALEGELSRTISSFANIKTARVHIVMPKKELFSKGTQEPRASIMIDLKGSTSLTSEQIASITNLVTAAVPDLDSKKISIVNTKGKALKNFEENADDPAIAANNGHEFKILYENKIKNIIEDLIMRAVGQGAVEAQVSADINFDRIITNEEKFDPDGQVARSIQTIEEDENSKDQSTINAAGGGQQSAGEVGQTASATKKTEETTNYEISKTVTNHIAESGTIKRISVAVLVDGRYIENKNTKNTDYLPRTDEELKKLESLVKLAIGFDEKRGDQVQVINMQFNKEKPEPPAEETIIDWFKTQLQSQVFAIVKSIIAGIIIILLIVLFIKPLLIKLFETASASIKAQVEAEIAIAQAEVQSANIKAQAERETRAIEIDNKVETIKLKKSTALKSINDIAEQCPQETVMVLRNWINS